MSESKYKLTPEYKEKIAELAKSLPPLIDKGKPKSSRSYLGSQLIEQGYTKDKNDKKINPRKRYVFPPEHPKVNHREELIKAFLLGGWEWCIGYQNKVIEIFQQQLPDAIAEHGNIEGEDKSKSSKK